MMDPIADKVIEHIIANNGKQGINNLFSYLRKNSDINSIELPDVVKDYFTQTGVLPEWADREKIKRGQEVYARYGPEIALCLLCKSLPQAYACANGAKVLYATGRLADTNGDLSRFTRRLMETSQFVVNVCAEGGLEPNGSGLVTAQKVRLIHAAIRYYIKRHDWPTEDYGQPINQQDMAGTLQSFSSLILEGLDTLTIKLTPEEKDAYYHCWHVVGHVMGINKNLNPSCPEEGFILGNAIFQDQMEASKEGTELTEAIGDFMRSLLPAKPFRHAPEAIIRYLIGSETAKKHVHV